MQKTRIGIALATAAMLLSLSVGSVAAGEVTGTGEPTPVKSWVAKSICAFSGLNDREVGGGRSSRGCSPSARSFGPSDRLAASRATSATPRARRTEAISRQ